MKEKSMELVIDSENDISNFLGKLNVSISPSVTSTISAIKNYIDTFLKDYKY